MSYEPITQPIVAPRLDRRRFRIVVGLDLSEYAEIVLEHALDQAARHECPDLHFITVREKNKQQVHELKSGLFSLVTGGIDAFNMGSGDWRARLHVRSGNPADEISMLAADILADLVVVGRHGAGAHKGDGRIGTVADRTIALAPCPTLIVGLTEHEVQTSPQCPACADVREQTHGDVIFCQAHSSFPQDRADLAPQYLGRVM
ncbi:MAG TPA: universal stress protein [Kofleriaceae bacterium]|jgi:nucleotide-binding universal stress UspA family protein|nr:universal stress protein [Kofleriaceae bacterium]